MPILHHLNLYTHVIFTKNINARYHLKWFMIHMKISNKIFSNKRLKKISINKTNIWTRSKTSGRNKACRIFYIQQLLNKIKKLKEILLKKNYLDKKWIKEDNMIKNHKVTKWNRKNPQSICHLKIGKREVRKKISRKISDNLKIHYLRKILTS